MSDNTASSSSPFAVRTVAILIAVAVISFGAFMVLAGWARQRPFIWLARVLASCSWLMMIMLSRAICTDRSRFARTTLAMARR